MFPHPSQFTGSLRQWSVTISLAFMLLVNSMANALSLNGKGTGEISNSFAVYFKPAGYVFSIWGVIYLLLTVFVVYQLFPARKYRADLDKLGFWFCISSFANAFWLIFWHYLQFPITQLLMFALLGCLIRIYTLLDVDRKTASTTEKIIIHLPFRLYLAWVSVATIANFTILLKDLGFSGLGIHDERWAVILLIVGLIVAISVALPRGDFAFIAVYIWAYVGIGKQFPASEELASFAFSFAWFFTGLIAAILLLRIFHNGKTPKTSEA